MKRVVVVTGGGKGIGREIALGVSKRGDTSIIVDKDYSMAKETEHLIKESGFLANSYCADLTKPEEVASVFKEIFRDCGKIDVLINNAGYYCPKAMEELTIDFWDFVIDTNLKIAFLCSLEVFKYMKTANYGKIVNLSSALAFTSGTELSPYITAKAGIIGLTRALAMDMGPYNITVNAVAPGLTPTESALEVFRPERFEQAKSLRAIKRDETVGDLAGAILFLIDASSDFMTGQTLVVDGGRVFT